MDILNDKKAAIIDQNGYKVYLDIEAMTIPTHADCYSMKFTTTWIDAKDPDAEHKKFELVLEKHELAALKEFINEC